MSSMYKREKNARFYNFALVCVLSLVLCRANGRYLDANIQTSDLSDSSIMASELINNVMKNASLMQYNPFSGK